jgi:hypothetical protein
MVIVSHFISDVVAQEKDSRTTFPTKSISKLNIMLILDFLYTYYFQLRQCCRACHHNVVELVPRENAQMQCISLS